MISTLSDAQRRSAIAALVAERARRRATFPLSSAQLRLWLIDRTVDVPIYNVSRAFTLEGHFNAEALSQSIEELVQRHDSLRTTYHLKAGSPLQMVNREAVCRIDRRDLAHRSGEDRDRDLADLIKREARYRFRLDQDCLLRALLVRLAGDRHVLVLTMHHIAVDEWSLALLYADVRKLYATFASGDAPPPQLTQGHYADYAVWEHAHNRSDAVQAQIQFWLRRLADAPPAFVLPGSLPPRERPSHAGGVERCAIGRERAAALAALARAAGATPYMAYLAAFVALLHDASRSADIVIGSPISGRRGVDAENIVGFFANAVALRFDCSAQHSFGASIERAKAVTLEAFAHRDAPFDHVVKALGVRRDRGTNPLFDVMFAMQSVTGSELVLDGLSVTPIPAEPDAAKCDLLAIVDDTSAGVDWCLHYSTDRFAPHVVQALSKRFIDLLDRMIAQPDVPIASLQRAPSVAVHPALALAPPAADEPGRERAPDAASAFLLGQSSALVREMWQELLERETIGDDDDFFVLGGHSLLAVRLLARIEAQLGIRLAMAAFFARPTIAALAGAIVDAARRPSGERFEPLRRGANARPIVFFHGDYTAGGLYLRAIAPYLGDRTIYAVPPHGSDAEEIPLSIEAMAAERIVRLRRDGIAPPFDLIGHCNGALVALEIGRQLAAAGEAPPRVFAISAQVYDPLVERISAVVNVAGRFTNLDPRARAKLVLRALRWCRGVRAGGPRAAGHFAAEQIGRFFARVARLRAARNGLPNHAVTTSLYSAYSAYSERLVQYRPGPYAGRLVVFCPREDARDDGRSAAWARVSPAVEIVPVRGNHLSSITTHALSLADQLRGTLDE